MPRGKLLLRLDSGHDAQENRERLVQEAQVDFLIKWNPRQQKPEEWQRRAEKPALGTEETTWRVEWSHPREGKRVALFSQRIEEHYTRGPRKGESYTLRRVVRITERHIDKKGQLLLIPEITLSGWWTTLDEPSHANQRIIKLYKDHATSEQFHSEFKSDLDLERLPSGKFDTNDLVLTLGALTYNIEALDRLDGFNRPSLTGSASSQETAAPNGDAGVDVLGSKGDREWTPPQTPI